MVDQAANMPQRCDLTLWRGDDQRVFVEMRNSATQAAMDPRGYTWSAPIYETREDALDDVAPLAEFAVAFDGNKIELKLLRTTMAGLAMGPYVWGLRADYGSTRRTFLAGALRLPA